MKSIPEVKLELLTDPTISVIIHQCKTTNKFDYGLAAQIKKMYPAAWLADCEAAKNRKNTLGNYSWTHVHHQQ
jgi:O-acetyl-ADP-ribose deacetylase (regulator of RNase III)